MDSVVFREGTGWILLDYKTDRIDDEDAFVEEYHPQLEWYRTAREKLTGLPVSESRLYALSVDKAFNLSQQASQRRFGAGKRKQVIHRTQSLESKGLDKCRPVKARKFNAFTGRLISVNIGGKLWKTCGKGSGLCKDQSSGRSGFSAASDGRGRSLSRKGSSSSRIGSVAPATGYSSE